MIETITLLVDPPASRLPRLRDPRAVGDALLGLAVTYFVIAVLVVVPRALPGVGAILGHQWSSPTWAIPPRAAAAVLGLAAVGWIWLLGRTPPDAPTDTARRDLRRMWMGQVAWSLAALVPVLVQAFGVRDRVVLAPLEVLAVPFAALALIGLRSLLALVGRRSRAYRTAQGGRQSIDALIGAILAGAVGNLMIGLGSWSEVELLEAIGQTVFGVSAALLLLGLLYLVVNCAWIRAALRRPPPKLDDLLISPDGDGGAIGDGGDPERPA